MSNLRDVQEAVLIFVLLIYRGHERSGRGQDLVDKDEDGLLRRKLNPLADHVDELAHCEVCGDEVLLLVDGRDVRLLDLLADDLRLLAGVRSRGGGLGDVRECGRCTSGGCARPQPCASRRGARP
jgi:hypothetical protein